MTITREQFIRGFKAIGAHYAGRDKIEEAMRAAGWDDSRLGFDPVVQELQRQLQERCGDTTNDPYVGTDISYALTERGVVEPGNGAEPFIMDSAEAVWRWWEETKTGPFRAGVEVTPASDGMDVYTTPEAIASLTAAERAHGEDVAIAMITTPPSNRPLSDEDVDLLKRGMGLMVISPKHGEWTGGIWPFVGRSNSMIDLEHPRFGVGSFFPSELSYPRLSCQHRRPG